MIGLGRALDLILTGRGIDGKEADQMGLVTKLCKKGKGRHCFFLNIHIYICLVKNETSYLDSSSF